MRVDAFLRPPSRELVEHHFMAWHGHVVHYLSRHHGYPFVSDFAQFVHNNDNQVTMRNIVHDERSAD